MNLAQLATSNNGHVTWAFSQSRFNTWRHYRTFGICAALSAHWIKEHAHGGSLANILGSGGIGGLNVAKLKEIALLHGHVSNGDGGSQASDLGLWLKMNDVLPLAKSRTVEIDSFRFKGWQGRSIGRGDMNESSQAIANIEGEMVLAMQDYHSCYFRLNFGGKAFLRSAGHAVAAWLGGATYSSGGDALFFDPNYGEFWFEDKADFFRFFPGYYRAKYLSGAMSFNKRWEILPCAKKAW